MSRLNLTIGREPHFDVLDTWENDTLMSRTIKVSFSQVSSTSKCRLFRCPQHHSVVLSGVFNIKVSSSQVSSTSKCRLLICPRHQSVGFSGVLDIKVSFLRCPHEQTTLWCRAHLRKQHFDVEHTWENNTLMSSTHEKTTLWCQAHLRKQHFDVEHTWENNTLMSSTPEKTTLWCRAHMRKEHFNVEHTWENNTLMSYTWSIPYMWEGWSWIVRETIVKKEHMNKHFVDTRFSFLSQLQTSSVHLYLIFDMELSRRKRVLLN
jgi:hypothetical protein